MIRRSGRSAWRCRRSPDRGRHDLPRRRSNGMPGSWSSCFERPFRRRRDRRWRAIRLKAPGPAPHRTAAGGSWSRQPPKTNPRGMRPLARRSSWSGETAWRHLRRLRSGQRLSQGVGASLAAEERGQQIVHFVELSCLWQSEPPRKPPPISGPFAPATRSRCARIRSGSPELAI